MPDVIVNVNGNVQGGTNQQPATGGNGNNQQQPLPPRTGTIPPNPSTPQPSNNPPVGTPGGGGNSGNPSNSQPNTGNEMPAMPTYDRMAQDIRREISARGVMLVPGSANFTQLMNTITSQQRNQAFAQIDQRHAEKVTDTQKAYDERQKAEIDKLEEERKQKLQGQTYQGAIDNINNRYDNRIKNVTDNLTIERGLAINKLNEDADNEKSQVEKDLAKIAAEIVQELKKGQGGSGSYLGGLREKYNEAIQRRNNAQTEGEAIAASREAAAIQAQIQRGMGGGGNPLQRFRTGWGNIANIAGVGMEAYNAYMDNTRKEIGEVNQASSGDFIGAMQADLERRRGNWAKAGGLIGAGVLGTVGAIFGGGLPGGAGGAAIGGAAGSWIGSSAFNTFYGGKEEENQLALASLWASQEKRINAYSDLALINNRASGKGVEAERNQLVHDLPDVKSYGIGVHDLGLTAPEFAQHVRSRLLQRGYADSMSSYDMAWRALEQESLEKVYNMSSGSLGQLSSYDRYTTNRRHNNATQDVANLVASLARRGTLGMSGGQTFRTNEFVNYQMQLMEQQKAFMNPDSNYAQRVLLAAQNAFGNNLDSRAISEYGQIENAVTHPQEGYSKAILYDVIQNQFADTRGNLLKIREKQFSDDPNVRMQIQQAMFKRLTQIYGGVDTTSGYLALSQYTGIENPRHLRAWVNQIRNGLPQVSQGSVSGDMSAMNEYTPEASKKMLKYQDQITSAINENLGSMVDLSQKMLDQFNAKLYKIINELSNH